MKARQPQILWMWYFDCFILRNTAPVHQSVIPWPSLAAPFISKSCSFEPIWFNLPKMTLVAAKHWGSFMGQPWQWSDLPLTPRTLTYQSTWGCATLALDSGVGNGRVINWWQYQSSPQSQSSLASPGHSQNTLWMCVCVAHVWMCLCSTILFY